MVKEALVIFHLSTVQIRAIYKNGLQVTSFTRKRRKYSAYKGQVDTVTPNSIRRLKLIFLIKRLPQILQNLSIMKSMQRIRQCTNYTWIHLWICVKVCPEKETALFFLL